MAEKGFTELMAEIPSHSARMKEAAKMGREGYVIPNVEKEGAFSATYAIVCLMAGKDVDGLEAVVLRHRSWPIRARALQCLGKLDQAKLARLLVDPSIPVQMRSVIIKSLNVGDDETLTAVLSNQSWGGIIAAIELMRRLPRGEVYEELMRTWLPKLGSMNRLLGDTISKKHDEEYLYQSAAAKYPKLMLEMLRKEKGDIDFKWYRASKVLAVEHPDDLVEILREKSWNPRAVWFIARPLVKHRPDEVCAIFKERKIVDDGLFWCLRTIFHSTKHRRLLLDIVLEHIKFVPSDTGDRLIKLLTKKCRGMFRVDTELTELHLTKYNVDWLGLLVELSESTPYKMTKETLERCLEKHVLAKRTSEASIEKIRTHLKMTDDERDAMWRSIYESEQTSSRFAAMIREQSLVKKGFEANNFYETVPHSIRDEILVEYSKTEEYLELDMRKRCNLLAQIPYEEALQTLKILSNDTDPGNRAVGLRTLWTAAVKRGRIPELKEACSFIHGKIKRDHEEVTTPVIREILLQTPHELLSQMVDEDRLLNLFTVSLGLCKLHADGWGEWCAQVFVRAPVHEGDETEDAYSKLQSKLIKRVDQESRLGSQWPRLTVKALQRYRVDARKGLVRPHTGEELGRVVEAIEEASEDASMFTEYKKRTREQTANTVVPESLIEADYRTGMKESEILECWNHQRTIQILEFYGADLLMASPHARRHATKFLRKLVYKNTSPVAAALILDIDTLPEKRILAWPQYAVFVKKALMSLLDLSQQKSVGYCRQDGRILVSEIVKRFLRALPMVSTVQAEMLFRKGVPSKLASRICKYSMPYEALWAHGCDVLSSCCVSWENGIPKSFIPDTHSKERGRTMLNNHDRTLLDSIHGRISDLTTELIDLLPWREDNVRGVIAGCIAASATPRNLVNLFENFEFRGEITSHAVSEMVKIFCRCDISYSDVSYPNWISNLFGLDSPKYYEDDFGKQKRRNYYLVHRAHPNRQTTGRAVRNRFTRSPEGKKRIVRRAAIRTEQMLSRKMYGLDDVILVLDKLAKLKTSYVIGYAVSSIGQNVIDHNICRIKECHVHPDYITLLKKCIRIYKQFDPCDLSYYNYNIFGQLSHLTTIPEAYDFVIRQADKKEDINSLLTILSPHVTRESRILQLLTTGVPEMANFSAAAREACSPQMCFNKSRDVQKFVFEKRQDLLIDLLPGHCRKDYYLQFGSGRANRFAGQQFAAGNLFTLPPACQQALYSHLLKVFDIDNTNYTDSGYHIHTMSYWLYELNVICALTDVPELDDLSRDDHPFRKLFESVIKKKIEWGDKELPSERGGLDKCLPNYKEGCALLEGMIKTRELLIALRTYHDQEQALDMVEQHLDIGLIEKTCIPSTSNLLRTVSPIKAAKVLTKIFDRRETKVAARLQLSRSVVHCLGAHDEKEAVRLIRQESRVDIANKTADKGVFVSLTNALATSTLLRQVPSLWDVMLYITQNPPTEESRYVAKQLLHTLSGKNNVKSLNSPYWPYGACPGLAGLCSSFLGCGSLDADAVTSLERWLAFVMANPTHIVDEKDATQVVDSMKRTTNSDLMTRVCLALTQHGHPDTIVRVVDAKINLLKKALESCDFTAARGILDTLSGLSVTKRRHLVACEAGSRKAAEVLLSNVATRQFGLRLLAGMIDFKNPAVGSDDLFAAFFKVGWGSLIALMTAVKEAYTSQNSPRDHLQRRAVRFLRANEASTDLNVRLMKLLLVNSVAERSSAAVQNSLFILMQDPDRSIATAAINLFPRPEAAKAEKVAVRTVV
eukprot:TRINITY_DN1348_c0_g1_i7.p1 TRINITY_DN1348_c0_g1~~TRINITY_DN1348_c0_g1_i7.p1  ORF type:complete len:1778 (+),score=304.53 TRINITY_DN1348_c0_g1_i7:56-5389(+)